MGKVYVSNRGLVILPVGEKEKIIGQYDKVNRVYRVVRKDKHILKKKNAFGFNFDFLSSYPVEEIQVIYNNKLYAVLKEVLVAKGFLAKYKNYEQQVFLPLEEFTFIR